MAEASLRDFQKIIDEWITTIGVRYYSELTNTAVLMEEV
ncbi:MAG: pyrophosphatase, partial [Candidatus Promineifilaceae bacterium]